MENEGQSEKNGSNLSNSETYSEIEAKIQENKERRNKQIEKKSKKDDNDNN
jgi:hypothetical protein